MPGGKCFQRKLICPKFPPPYNHAVYVECFVGAGSIFFEKHPHKKEVINDKDTEISFFYSYLKNNFSCPDFPEGKVTREDFLRWRDLKPGSDKQRFIKHFIVQQFSFRGNRHNYSPIRGEHYRLDNCLFIQRYKQYHERLQGVTILNDCYLNVVKKYNVPEAFFYLDPPYETGTESDVTAASNKGDWYGTVKLSELVDCLNSIKGKWMLSFSDNKELKDMLNIYNIETYKTVKCSTRGGMVKE